MSLSPENQELMTQGKARRKAGANRQEKGWRPLAIASSRRYDRREHPYTLTDGQAARELGLTKLDKY
jgi:hypothetical protein